MSVFIKHFIISSIAVGLAGAITGCKEDASPGGEETVAGTEEIRRLPPPASSPPLAEQAVGEGAVSAPDAPSSSVESPPLPRAFAMTRLTPEQASATIARSLGVRLGDDNFDLIIQAFGVALGGVDFDTVLERDREAQVQTVLVSRSIAWTTAIILVSEENKLPRSGRVVFKEVDLLVDGPDNAAAAWERQLTDLYWRLFARPPRPEEVRLIGDVFRRIVAENGQGPLPAFGWMGVVYSLLSTEEFWYP